MGDQPGHAPRGCVARRTGLPFAYFVVSTVPVPENPRR
jgi:hypothetical protein